MSIVTYFLQIGKKNPLKLCAVRQYLEGTPNFLTSCPSLVYFAHMHGIYKPNVPVLIKKTSFEVRHCKIDNFQCSDNILNPNDSFGIQH